MSQLLLITDFDLPPDQVQSFLSTTFYFSFLVFFALFCFLFLCLLLLVAVNVALIFMESKNFDDYNHES